VNAGDTKPTELGELPPKTAAPGPATPPDTRYLEQVCASRRRRDSCSHDTRSGKRDTELSNEDYCEPDCATDECRDNGLDDGQHVSEGFKADNRPDYDFDGKQCAKRIRASRKARPPTPGGCFLPESLCPHF